MVKQNKTTSLESQLETLLFQMAKLKYAYACRIVGISKKLVGKHLTGIVNHCHKQLLPKPLIYTYIVNQGLGAC